ncbi:beta-N-acetylhexosaminidase [Vallitalea okinawensis]|uniref:beta-N-acetylhexosaminidase n=1 Tax=Vallitalea okinawensis TaxID=2078660 RepID=UPI000CFB24B7|nr:beta-N-acetylhexosaminidase [Vallitalea okinawensis]
MIIPIIPKPVKALLKNGDAFVFNEETPIRGEECLEKDMLLLQELLTQYLSISPKVDQNIEETGIHLNMDSQLKVLGKEGYQLEVSRLSIKINSSTHQGLFYGMQSLLQLIYNALRDLDGNWRIDPVFIEDMPRFTYRGYMLDVCRHFFDKNAIKKMIDLASLHKLNYFHWHLTEDQGWRIEINQYPLLTEIGSFRKETIVGNKSDDRIHSGYYTKEEIKEIVDYAASRFITIIPEIDVPGHFQAALAAYPHLSCNEQPLDVATKFGIIDNIACAGKETTFEFLFNVLDEVCEMFPSPYIHLGGDEAPKTRWKLCKHCRRRMEVEGLANEEELQGYFINRLAQYLDSMGKRIITWNESLKASCLDSSIMIQHWMDGKKAMHTTKAIESGRQVIISDFFHYYLDYPYGMTPLSKTYNYNPILEGILPDNEKAIIGIEAPLWTEYIERIEKAEWMTLPRLSALSEVGWSWKHQLNYEDFKKRMLYFTKFLREIGYHVATTEEADIKGIKAKLQVLKFFIPLLNLETVKALYHNIKEKK